MKTNSNAESHAETKRETLVQQMAMPNVITKENPDTQRMGYDPRVAKTDHDAEGYAGQVLSRSGWATV